jgi:hypothetical protein
MRVSWTEVRKLVGRLTRRCNSNFGCAFVSLEPCIGYTAGMRSLTRRFLGTGTTVSCAANATERRRSVDMAHRTLAW